MCFKGTQLRPQNTPLMLEGVGGDSKIKPSSGFRNQESRACPMTLWGRGGMKERFQVGKPVMIPGTGPNWVRADLLRTFFMKSAVAHFSLWFPAALRRSPEHSRSVVLIALYGFIYGLVAGVFQVLINWLY